MSSEAKNLEAIAKAIEYHDNNCQYKDKAKAVLLNPFEVERLDWDEILGVPILGDPEIPTGRIRILCDGQNSPSEIEEQEVEVIKPRETIYS